VAVTRRRTRRMFILAVQTTGIDIWPAGHGSESRGSRRELDVSGVCGRLRKDDLWRDMASLLNDMERGWGFE